MGPGNYVSSTASYYNAPKRGLNKKLLLITLGIVAVIVIILCVVVSASHKDNIGTESQHLSAQLTNLKTLTTSASDKLSDGNLQKLNAETSIITSGVNANLASIMPKQVDKTIVADESDASDTDQLNNAALAGTYDSSYKTILQQRLEKLTALLSSMYDKTKSTDLKDSLSADYNNLQAILTNLDKLN